MIDKLILIAEDDPTLLNALEAKISLEGFKTITASDGQEGLKKALSNQPDLILLDVMMPKMDGMEMMNKLRQDDWGKKVPVIILTNKNVDDKIISQITKNQPSYYLTKSNTQLYEIIEKINEVLGIN
jgi:two-component system, OmpR family, alkaline phosphatase synthesis response regulator PhoP